MHYHLAQVNVARLRDRLDSPLLADFVAQLDPVNAIADGTPGFVWRWVGNSADMMELLNISVWETVDSLFAFTYRDDHVAVFRERLKWFEPPQGSPFALWWVPAGHIPSTEEAYARLAWLRKNGPGPFAFTFKQRFEQPADPGVVRDGASAISWDGRTMLSAANTPNGDVNGGTVFHYRQEGRRVWATYDGGGVRFGTLVACADESGRLNMRYQHANDAGELRSGECVSVPEVLPDGRLRVEESWRWTGGEAGRGVLVEAGAGQEEFAVL
ncbi:MAG: DUF3291 domain-containing protein [Bryobacteraceae bacterium]